MSGHRVECVSIGKLGVVGILGEVRAVVEERHTRPVVRQQGVMQGGIVQQELDGAVELRILGADELGHHVFDAEDSSGSRR